MQQRNNDIYLIGAGGHAKVILALLEEQGRKCLGIYDDDKALWGKMLSGIPVIGSIKELPDKNDISAVIAVGNNNTRKQIAGKFHNLHWETLIHPHSWVHKSVKIQEGTVIFAGVVIQPDVCIGKHTIINTSASIDHDCHIGNYCHIAPGCHLAGGVNIEDNTFLGVGTTVIPSISITSNTTIGAGAAVVDNITHSGTYIGVPARLVSRSVKSDA